MSHPDVIIGYVREYPPYLAGHKGRDFEVLHATNDAAIAALPDADTFPPLIRSMVTVPRADQPLASFRGWRIISVALHGNHVFLSLPQWLDKFESRLLRRLLWSEARLYYRGEHQCVDHCVVYRADKAAIEAMSASLPVPPQAWTFCVNEMRCDGPAHWGMLPDLRGRPGYRDSDPIRSIPEPPTQTDSDRGS